MFQATEFRPFINEHPSHFADRLGVLYSNSVTTEHKKENGQFFTPTEIAHFMAKLARKAKPKLKILDPGCGTAVLSCALIETFILRNDPVREIDLVVYETDKEIIIITRVILDYLKQWLQIRGVTLKTVLKSKDFVIDNKDCFDQASSLFYKPNNSQYDIVISNPPYFKVGKEDKRALIAKSIVWGQPNIYSIFLITATNLLKNNGELIFIIPRSFAAGNYFREFRKAFFYEVEIEQIHLFNSRTDTFTRDKVLQETLIVKGKKQKQNTHSPTIILSHSNGIADLNKPSIKKYLTSDLIDFNSKEKILHLPSTTKEDQVIKLFKSWEGRLFKYGMQISTGPVVSFRATEYIYENNVSISKNLVPLYQLINTGKMRFEFPVFKRSKPQYIECCDQTKSLLLPNKNYLFLRRFSAKDDKCRLVATPYISGSFQTDFIGVENHLNYIYRPNGELSANEIFGLAAILNSKLFDTYFRTFNGNINVSATELREMPLPPLDDIKEIGNLMLENNNHSLAFIDEVVNDFFSMNHIFSYEQS